MADGPTDLPAGYLSDPDIRAAMDGWGVYPVLARFGQWAVTLYGVECLSEPYWIEWDRVNDPDWLDHMRRKRWVVMADFAAALDEAKRRLAPGRARRRFMVMRRDGFACQLCGAKATNGAKLEIDHKVPRAKGGGDDPDNLWTLCWTCNRGKSSLDLT